VHLQVIDEDKAMTDGSKGKGAVRSGSGGEAAEDPRRPHYVMSRLRYFDGEFLACGDFTDEQDYHVDRQVRHQAQLHAPGIMDGLEVSEGSDGLSVSVSFGSAIDADGNQILVSNEQGAATGVPISVPFPSAPENGDYVVYARFVEKGSDPQDERDTRFTQYPGAMLHIERSLPDGVVQLARLRYANGSFEPPDTDCLSVEGSAAKYAGVRLPGPSGRAATLRIENVSDSPDKAPDYKAVLAAGGGLTVDGAGLWVPDTITGSRGRVSIGRNYAGAPENYLEVWNGSGIDAESLVAVSDDGFDASVPLNANQGLAVPATLAAAGGNVSVGNGDGAPSRPLEVYDEGGNRLLSVSGDDGLVVAGKATVSNALAATSTLDVGGLLTASGGLTVAGTACDTHIGANGKLSVGRAYDDVGHLLEVWDPAKTASSDHYLFAVTNGEIDAEVALKAKAGLQVTGQASVSESLTVDGALNVKGPLSASDGLAVTGSSGDSLLVTNNDGNVIVLRKLKIGEEGENTSSPTYPLEVYDKDQTLRFFVSAEEIDAKVKLKAKAGLEVDGGLLAAHAGLEVSGGSLAAKAGLEVGDGLLKANAGLAVSGGMTLSGASSLFGSWDSKSVNTSYTATSDGFVVAYMSCIKNSEKNTGYEDGYGDFSGQSGDNMRCKAAVFVENTSTRQASVPFASFTMPVKKDEAWVVYWARDSGDHPPDICIYWISFGNS
jgi:hypothetical protein